MRRVDVDRRVAAAFFADLDRAAFDRRAAAVRAWRDNDCLDAALWPSRLSAPDVARERLADGLAFWGLLPLLTSRAACCLVLSEIFPFFGGFSFTPARRALDRPMAMACFVDRAPCLPSRI